MWRERVAQIRPELLRDAGAIHHLRKRREREFPFADGFRHSAGFGCEHCEAIVNIGASWIQFQGMLVIGWSIRIFGQQEIRFGATRVASTIAGK